MKKLGILLLSALIITGCDKKPYQENHPSNQAICKRMKTQIGDLYNGHDMQKPTYSKAYQAMLIKDYQEMDCSDR